ncbi:MAG: hypothetical protein QHH06_05440 [Clostridiales bacterium]|jgi:hypothetical protein|nr:hypothetical protein [Eubacteriales bacterium]MDH7565910.1 hypothetical protein [Clostridiales bacterium]
MRTRKIKVVASCSRELHSMIEKRAKQLEMGVPTYLIYAAIKDIEEERNKLCEGKDDFK